MHKKIKKLNMAGEKLDEIHKDVRTILAAEIVVCPDGQQRVQVQKPSSFAEQIAPAMSAMRVPPLFLQARGARQE